MVTLIESNPKYWVIEINPELNVVGMPQKKRGGYTWIWGTNFKVYKLKQALYPKDLFTKAQMLRIMRKYKVCPNCTIGRKNLKLKYPKIHNKSMAYKQNLHASYPLIWLTEKIIPQLRGSSAMRSFWKANIATILGKLATIPESYMAEEFAKYLYKLLVGLGLISAGAVMGSKGLISSDLQDELMIIGNGVWFQNPSSPGFGYQPMSVHKLQASAERIIGKAGMGGFGDLGVAAARIKNAVGRGFSQFVGAFSKIGKGGRFWQVPTTHAPLGGLGGGSMGKFSTKESDDYGYQISDRWFQDVSKFSPAYITGQRLKISGDVLT